MTVIYVCKMISSGVFSIFREILIFWVHRWIKGQKTVQNDKKLCLSHSISQEPYITWLSFMVQMCKMIISAGVFFNVKILIFQVVIKGLKGQKMAQNVENFCQSHLMFQELYIIWSSCMVHINVQKDNISRHFFHFFRSCRACKSIKSCCARTIRFLN